MTAPVVVPRSCSVIPLQPSTMSRSAAATAPNEYLSMVFMRPSMLFVGGLGERGGRLRGQSRWHADLLQQVGELVGVLLFHREDRFEQAARGRILVAQVLDEAAVTVDGDALGHQVFADHVGERH